MARMFIPFAYFCSLWVLDINTKTPRDSQLTARARRSKSDINLRVHKGRDLRDGEYPYVIIMGLIIENQFWRFSTGSMISETWGITAAHCFEEPDVVIQYDNFTQSPIDTGCYVPVLEMYSHPSYRFYSPTRRIKDVVVNNDIGVFRTKSVPKKAFAVLMSTDYSTLIGLPVVYVGAGMTNWEFDYEDDIRPLQLGEAIIVNCDTEMRSISNFVICLASKCSNRLETSWYGDSGGPLIYDGKIIGVNSYGFSNRIMVRGGFTPVSPYIDWINYVMNKKD